MFMIKAKLLWKLCHRVHAPAFHATMLTMKKEQNITKMKTKKMTEPQLPQFLITSQSPGVQETTKSLQIVAKWE